MLYREILAVYSQIHTKHINTLCGQNVEFVNVKLMVHIVTSGTLKLSAVHDPGYSRTMAVRTAAFLSPLLIPTMTPCTRIANLRNTASIQQSPLGRFGSSSPSQEISPIFRNAEVHNSPPLVPSRSQINPYHSLQSRSCKVYSNHTLIYACISKWSRSFRFQYQNPVSISLLPNSCHMPRPSELP